MTRDLPDAAAEVRLRAALADRYPVEPVDDEQFRRVMGGLASGASHPEPLTALPLTALPLAAPGRRRGWTTALLAAAVAVVVALVGVSATLLLADGSSSSPAVAPTLPVASGEVPATPSAPPTSGAITSAAPSATVPLSAPAPDRSPVAAPVETPPPAVPESPAAGPSTTGTDPGSPPTTAPPSAGSVAVDPQAFRVDDNRFEVPGMIQFVSPSGNIECMMADQGVPGANCQIQEADYAVNTCPENTMDPFTVSFGVANAGQTSDGSLTPADTVGLMQQGCLGRLILENPSPLPYGSSLTLGDTTCVSETTGVTCRSLISGAGFEVSRSSYRLF